jgi:hypothetical protein
VNGQAAMWASCANAPLGNCAWSTQMNMSCLTQVLFFAHVCGANDTANVTPVFTPARRGSFTSANGSASHRISMTDAPVRPIPIGIRWQDGGAIVSARGWLLPLLASNSLGFGNFCLQGFYEKIRATYWDCKALQRTGSAARA